MIPFATPFFNATSASGGSGGHRYWRVNIAAVGSGTLAALAEVQLYESAFGANKCSGGSAAADSTFSSFYPASDAFDGGLEDAAANTNTSVWASANTALPHWVSYDFSVNREIVQLGLHGRSSANSNQNPTALTVQYSDDNSTWIDAWSATGLIWAANEYKRLTKPSYSVPAYAGSPHGSHTYWRIFCNMANGTGGINIAEAELRAIPGGADQCSGGAASASSIFSGSFVAANAFDNNNTTSWNNNVAEYGWLQYQFASPVEVAEIMIRARASGSPVAGPTNMCVQWSDDGALWTSAWSVSGEAAWSLGEARTFTDPNYV